MKDNEEMLFSDSESQDIKDMENKREKATTGDSESEEFQDVATDETAGLKTQVADLENRLMRVYADLDNLRRRSRMEKEELSTYANSKLITEMLPVVDNLALALQAAAGKEDDELVKGVDMVFKQFLSVLEKSGVTMINPVGETFDPNRHEAVLSESVEGTEAGIVLQVLRTGYQLGDRVLRPAMVKVSGERI